MSVDKHKKGKPAPERSRASASPARGAPGRPASRPARRRHRLSTGVKALVIVGLAVVVLGAIFVLNNPRASAPAADTSGGSSADAGLAGKYAFQVGKPGPGEKAPPIKLPSTDGGTFDLASLRGRTVLLYFQEGVMCQPCWDQLKDIEANRDKLRALDIDKVVSITSDPLPTLKQKAAYEHLSSPLLSDLGVEVSKTYEANLYGMMGESMNGHSFVLVGEDGVIKWRADYGGEPNFTMYVPVPNLLADMREGLSGAAQ